MIADMESDDSENYQGLHIDTKQPGVGSLGEYSPSDIDEGPPMDGEQDENNRETFTSNLLGTE
jgi:hypothetical protein